MDNLALQVFSYNGVPISEIIDNIREGYVEARKYIGCGETDFIYLEGRDKSVVDLIAGRLNVSNTKVLSNGASLPESVYRVNLDGLVGIILLSKQRAKRSSSFS
jgi:hypothetical protein